MKKEMKTIEIGQVPEHLYMDIMSGFAKQIRKQIKESAKAHGQNASFNDKITDEEFVKKYLLQMVISGYIENESSIAAAEAKIRKKEEINDLLK